MKSPKKVYQSDTPQPEAVSAEGENRSIKYRVELITGSSVVLSDENGNGIRVTLETVGKKVKKGDTVRLTLP